jgi:hypothetical protein
MSNFKLTLPTDIPWVRKCVSNDMIDQRLCDAKSPFRWRSSIAIFEYQPEEDNQTYKGMIISYFKVTCSITGYQENSQEIGLNYHGLRSYWQNQPGIVDYLTTLQQYYPCYGAVLEFKVGPEDNQTNLNDYPYFLDFEPKKRELYELVSTSGETMSRSLNGVELGKSNTSLKSHEVVDIDKGFSVAASAQVGPYGGSGSFSRQGEWGTRDVTQNQASDSRAIDSSQEMRETQSHTTQLSQMYHQLDSYHLGTNRALFFIHPRPHTLDTEFTFVNGPRNIEGIQEFMFVVARPDSVKSICTEAYLETGHIGKVPYTVEEETADSETKTFWNDSFHAAPLGNDDETTVVDDADRIWEVKNTLPGYKIKSAVFKLGDFKVDTNESGTPNLIDVVPFMSDQNADYIKVSGKVHSWFENVDVGRDNSASVVYPFSVDITLVKSTQVTRSRDTLFITGRNLCCCPRILDIAKEKTDGVVYEKLLNASESSSRDTQNSTSMPIVNANQLNAQIKEAIINSRNDLANRYETAIHLPQTIMAAQTLVNNISQAQQMKWKDVWGLSQPLTEKLNNLNPEVNLSEILSMPLQMQKDIFSLTDREVVEFRNAITGVHHRVGDLKEAWLSPTQIKTMFKGYDQNAAE